MSIFKKQFSKNGDAWIPPVLVFVSLDEKCNKKIIISIKIFVVVVVEAEEGRRGVFTWKKKPLSFKSIVLTTVDLFSYKKK